MEKKMTNEMTGLEIFPSKIPAKVKIPKEWDYTEAIAITKNIFKTMREDGGELLLEFLYAHEYLVNKKIPGKTWGGFCKEVGVDPKTPLNWFEKYRLPFTKIAGRNKEISTSPKHLKKHTKPAIKNALGEIAKEIEDGNVSDDDIRKVSKSIGKAIEREVSHQRTGSPIVNAIRKINQKKGGGLKDRKKSPLERLSIKLSSCVEQLQYLIDGSLETTEADNIHIRVIRKLMPGLVWDAHRLGIDIAQVYRTFIKPGKELTDDNDTESGREDIIEAEFKKVSK
jgi:hypothetical protein